jgi:hypothetical protein
VVKLTGSGSMACDGTFNDRHKPVLEPQGWSVGRSSLRVANSIGEAATDVSGEDDEARTEESGMAGAEDEGEMTNIPSYEGGVRPQAHSVHQWTPEPQARMGLMERHPAASDEASMRSDGQKCNTVLV